MSLPDPSTHNPDPAYLRELIALIGVSQAEAARRLGINEGQFRRYFLAPGRNTRRECPYIVQYALEQWAKEG